MNHQNLTCSRELAERMAELGICQDGAELWWTICMRNGDLQVTEMKHRGIFIAPTLSRMMEELPPSIKRKKPDGSDYYIYVQIDKHPDQRFSEFGRRFRVRYRPTFNPEMSNFHNDEQHDDYVPNALAKALIKLKEDGE